MSEDLEQATSVDVLNKVKMFNKLALLSMDHESNSLSGGEIYQENVQGCLQGLHQTAFLVSGSEILDN